MAHCVASGSLALLLFLQKNATTKWCMQASLLLMSCILLWYFPTLSQRTASSRTLSLRSNKLAKRLWTLRVARIYWWAWILCVCITIGESGTCSFFFFNQCNLVMNFLVFHPTFLSRYQVGTFCWRALLQFLRTYSRLCPTFLWSLPCSWLFIKFKGKSCLFYLNSYSFF